MLPRPPAPRVKQVAFDGVVRVQLPHFGLEEMAQVLWSSAKTSRFNSLCDPVLYKALRYWPDLLRTAVLQSNARPTAKNMAQIAYAYGKPMNSFTRPTVRPWRCLLPTLSVMGEDALPEVHIACGSMRRRSFEGAHLMTPSGACLQTDDGDVPLAFAGVLPLYIRCIPDFPPLTLSIVLWAYVSLRSSQEVVNKLAWAMYPAVCAKLNAFQPAELVAMAYALGLARLRHEPLLDIITGQCTARLRGFTGEVRTLAALTSRALLIRAAQVQRRDAPLIVLRARCRSVPCWHGHWGGWRTRTTSSLRRSSSNTSSRAWRTRSAWAS